MPCKDNKGESIQLSETGAHCGKEPVTGILLQDHRLRMKGAYSGQRKIPDLSSQHICHRIFVRRPMLAHKAEDEGARQSHAGKHGHVNYEAIASIVYMAEVASVENRRGMPHSHLKPENFSKLPGKSYDSTDGT